jgi:hypothetical protein
MGLKELRKFLDSHNILQNYLDLTTRADQISSHKNHILSNVLPLLSMSRHGTQQTINKKKNILEASASDTEERKRWLEGIKLWQQRKDAQCIVMHGYGWPEEYKRILVFAINLSLRA